MKQSTNVKWNFFMFVQLIKSRNWFSFSELEFISSSSLTFPPTFLLKSNKLREFMEIREKFSAYIEIRREWEVCVSTLWKIIADAISNQTKRLFKNILLFWFCIQRRWLILIHSLPRSSTFLQDRLFQWF